MDNVWDELVVFPCVVLDTNDTVGSGLGSGISSFTGIFVSLMLLLSVYTMSLGVLGVSLFWIDWVDTDCWVGKVGWKKVVVMEGFGVVVSVGKGVN